MDFIKCFRLVLLGQKTSISKLGKKQSKVRSREVVRILTRDNCFDHVSKTALVLFQHKIHKKDFTESSYYLCREFRRKFSPQFWFLTDHHSFAISINDH